PLKPPPPTVIVARQPFTEPRQGRRWAYGGSRVCERGRVSMAKTNPGEFIRQVRTEASKVVWPTRQETVRTAIFVAIMMTILAMFFLGVDQLFSAVVRWLLTLV